MKRVFFLGETDFGFRSSSFLIPSPSATSADAFHEAVLSRLEAKLALTSFQLRYLVKFARSQWDRRGPPGFWVNERFSIDPTYEVVPNQEGLTRLTASMASVPRSSLLLNLGI